MERKSSGERYNRQVVLKQFGEAGQDALLQAKVLVIGAGGLGCPVLQYLTAAGTGSIGIVDDDLVSLSNLPRQVLYDTHDIGKSKTAVAAAKLRLMNPDTQVVEYPIRLDKTNCLDIISGYDIIVDCTDNFASRYLINDACVIKEKPLVYAAVSGFQGQVAVFNVSRKERQWKGNYRDLFPEQPAPGEVMNCAEAGVLGVLPGIIGSIQACEVIKLITGMGGSLVNQLLTYNAIDNQVSVFAYSPNKHRGAIIPRNENDFHQMNYEQECFTGGALFEIDVKTFDVLLLQPDTLFIDVREGHELPLITEFEYARIPLGELKQKWNELSKGTIIFFCQSGTRSLQAATLTAEHFGNTHQCYSLQGGIVSWKKMHEKQLT